MNRRTFLCGLTLGSLSDPLAAEAQARKVSRVGFLGTSSASAYAPLIDGFQQGLQAHGWVEGRNIVIEYRWADAKAERLPDLAADLIRMPVDVIVTQGTAAAQTARDATRTVPIVMVGTHDPVGSGLVASLARPGGNVTGLALLTPDLVTKQLEILKEVLPGISQIAVLRNPASPPHALLSKEADRAGRTLRLQLHILDARDPADLDGAFSAMRRERADALLVLLDGMFFLNRTRLAELAAKSRLPAVYGAAEHAEVGGLMTYAPSLRENWRRAATYVDKLLKGAKPADLPVEQPTKFELVINLKTAKALGLTIPPSLLLRADQVIE